MSRTVFFVGTVVVVVVVAAAVAEAVVAVGSRTAEAADRRLPGLAWPDD